MLELDGELSLTDVTPELFHTLELLEPYGMANAEPVFAARGVQLTAPPRIMKEKHIKLKLRQNHVVTAAPGCQAEQSSAGADGRDSKSPLLANTARNGAPAENHSTRSESSTDLRSKVTFDALGWHMAERLRQKPLLAGDSVDIAFTVGNNDHPEYGGLELSLRDLGVR